MNTASRVWAGLRREPAYSHNNLDGKIERMIRACVTYACLFSSVPALALEVCDTNAPPPPPRSEFQCVVDTGIGPPDPVAPEAAAASVFGLDHRHRVMHLNICTRSESNAVTLPSVAFASYETVSTNGQVGKLVLSHEREYGQDVVVGEWLVDANESLAVHFAYPCGNDAWSTNAPWLEIVSIIDGIEVRESGETLNTFRFPGKTQQLTTPRRLVVLKNVNSVDTKPYSITTMVRSPLRASLR